MVRRQLFPLLWLAALACLAADAPPDITHVLEVRSGWEFAPAAEPPAIERLPEAWEPVKLPHSFEEEPCGLYRATFAVPAAWAGSRVSLVVKPPGGTAWVWLNGQLLGVRSPSALDVRLDASQAARAGARNSALIAVSPPSSSFGAGPEDQEGAGLAACRLEATGPIGIERLVVTPWCLAQGAVVDVALDVANGSRERFEGRVELALEAEAEGKQAPPGTASWRVVGRRASDVRMDPFDPAQGRAGQLASVTQSFEPDPPRLWRFDDPFLYRLTATVQTRDGQAVRTVAHRVGVRSTAASQGRWLANGEWVRLAAIAVAAPPTSLGAGPGATLLCTQPGQASALAGKLAGGQEPPLDELLTFCDEQGILAFLDAPACPPDAPGWRETLDALAAEALRHPCVWGWVVEEGATRDEGQVPSATSDKGKAEDSGLGARHLALDTWHTTLARLRDLTPRFPVGRPMPCTAAEAKEFDFLVRRFATRPGREDDDSYGRRLDDLVRGAGGKPVIAIDSVTVGVQQAGGDRLKPALSGDEGAELRKRTEGSLAHRCREVERRSQVAVLAFELDPSASLRAGADDALFAIAERRLSPFRLNPPRHEARLDREQFVVKSRFEVHLASPVAQRLPCYSLVGCRIAWAASRGGALVGSGTIPLTNAQARAIEGGAQPGRGEVEWRTDKSGDVEFAAELQTASGRVLARHAAKLELKAKDGKAEISVQPVTRDP